MIVIALPDPSPSRRKMAASRLGQSAMTLAEYRRMESEAELDRPLTDAEQSMPSTSAYS